MNLSDQTNIASTAASNVSVEMDIPFNKLHISRRNVRTKPHTQQDIECRAASIKAYGILNRLQVILEPGPDAEKEYGVIAGRGRYQSLEWLVNQGYLPADYPVKCDLRPVDEAIAIGLAENANRAPLHEADEFVAFKAMAEEGKSIETIAERFGIPLRTVQQRLRLGGLHPELIELYRKGVLDAHHVRAFCRTTDQARQFQVWNSLSQYERTPWHIRSKLSKETLDTNDPMVKFVGLNVYRDAGGMVTTDLFSQHDEGIVEDIALLHQLAVDKLRTIASDIATSEGWSWSDIAESFDWGHYPDFVPAAAECRQSTEQEQARLDKMVSDLKQLTEKRDSLYDALDRQDADEEERDGGDDEQSGAGSHDSSSTLQQQVEGVEAQIDVLESAIDELRASFVTYAEDVRAAGGVVVSLDGRGGVEVVRGLVRRVPVESDESSAQAIHSSASVAGQTSSLSRVPSSVQASATKKARPEISERLANQLSAHRTAAMQARMMNSPDVAMAAIVQRLLEGVSRRHRYGDNDVLKVSGRPSLDSLHEKAPDLKGMRASVEIRARIDAWRARIPSNSSDELAWLLSLDSAELHELFALCVALSIDATTGDASRRLGADLSAALQIDVANYWQATEVSYFSAVSKDAILASVEEACGPGSGMPIVKMKKGEAAKYAEQKLAGTRWLPMMLREQAVTALDGTLAARPMEGAQQHCVGVEAASVDDSAALVADQTPARGTDTAESGDTDAHALTVTAAEAE